MVRRLLFLCLLLAAPPAAAAPAREGPVELDGLIEPSLTVQVGSAVPGVLDAVRVDRGDFVEKGQVLASLESGVERSAVALAKARAGMKGAVDLRMNRLGFAERHGGRHAELYTTGLVSAAQKDEADSERRAAESELRDVLEKSDLAALELRQAEEVVERRLIRSPLGGVVVQRLRNPGEYVENQPVLKLARIDPLYVEVIAPVALYGSVKVGSRAEVIPEAPLRGRYPARVKVVDRVLDAASGSFGIRLELDNPRFEIPAGIKCRVRFLR